MSSSEPRADGIQVNCTAQQKPTELMGREALAAPMIVAVPPAPPGMSPLFGSRIGATPDTPTPLGTGMVRKLTDEPGPAPYGTKPLLPSGKLGGEHTGLVKIAGTLPFRPSSSVKTMAGKRSVGCIAVECSRHICSMKPCRR